MSSPIFHVNAFTYGDETDGVYLAGNPAAICLPEGPFAGTWKLGLAAQMNLSETAYVTPRPDGFGLEWFTPVTEVDLCGHATLASAHVLWSEGYLEADQTARFHTRSGLLTARHDGDWISLDFPATPSTLVDAPAGLADALGAEPARVAIAGKSLLAEFGTDRAVRSLRPDFGAMRAGGWDVIATAPGSTDEFDIVSRYFAPTYGIDEDPVTGSAHCALAPYWAERLDRAQFDACQASARGGFLRVRLDGDRVELRGRAATVLRGTVDDVPGAAYAGAPERRRLCFMAPG
jgi:PhzF family phenazine biosynthesis protein